VTLTGSQALLVEVSSADAARLNPMPTMIYEGEAEEDCFYVLPPIEYPDGSWLIKVGPSNCFNPPLRTKADVDAWFKRGHLDPAFESKGRQFFNDLFPGIDALSFNLFFVSPTTRQLNGRTLTFCNLGGASVLGEMDGLRRAPTL